MSRSALVVGLMSAVLLGTSACTGLGQNSGTVSTELKISPDSKWVAHKNYLEPILARVQRRWDQALRGANPLPKTGTSAIVVFEISATGSVARIVSVEGDAGLVGEKACVTAIVAEAPFPPWTETMKDSLGQSAQLTFTFFYQ